ncbi:hypothetical protein BofuT4_uP086570.1 [Botrytis cinerea T4]|uniref:Uncharacterized protein n=1 Tax=Botryotinia fuckeliana (strain T4) TaxID=999810 RepID=G2YGI0_BOTF4|nr:hypothetical protein BofuT4_uP086570.1 [Botrytis cinerea T4]
MYLAPFTVFPNTHWQKFQTIKRLPNFAQAHVYKPATSHLQYE